MPTLLTLSTLLVALLIGPSFQAPVTRVSMEDAKAHILTKVDPVIPLEAAQAKVGGIVSAEVVIRVDGTVESDTEVDVQLVDPRSAPTRRQLIRLRRDGERWTIVSLQ